MPLLDCSVNKCMYNKDCLCAKQEIQVDGASATSSEKTCCRSFKEQSSDSATNACCNASRSTGVACEAVKCLYNENHYCTANQIGIVGANATDADGTECATFKAK